MFGALHFKKSSINYGKILGENEENPCSNFVLPIIITPWNIQNPKTRVLGIRSITNMFCKHCFKLVPKCDKIQKLVNREIVKIL